MWFVISRFSEFYQVATEIEESGLAVRVNLIAGLYNYELKFAASSQFRKRFIEYRVTYTNVAPAVDPAATGSVNLKSGEYGGKYQTSQPAAFTNSSIRPLLWNVALSITSFCPGFKLGIKQVSNQVSFHGSIAHPFNREGSQ